MPMFTQEKGETNMSNNHNDVSKWKDIYEQGIVKFVIRKSIPIAIIYIFFTIYFSSKSPNKLSSLIIYNTTAFFIIMIGFVMYWLKISKKYKNTKYYKEK
ncbi:hypothetical protein SAMN02194393_04754 [Maledivibacter halophilus]|uniref:Uncharacterized protein n=1 Tax=Maledivibacter halophilus TaxID=36842 RepID=A0A1T5MIS9_9FIRM|nr:hypothetical protein SAMN02194393_04754 [Maledivibacter halophilus]